MTPEKPIACSLDTAELPHRLAEMAAIGRGSLCSVEVTDGRAALRFGPGGDTRRRLAAIVSAEAECCSFLKMELHDEPDAVELTIDAPAGAQPILDDMVAALRGTVPAA